MKPSASTGLSGILEEFTLPKTQNFNQSSSDDSFLYTDDLCELLSVDSEDLRKDLDKKPSKYGRGVFQFTSVRKIVHSKKTARKKRKLENNRQESILNLSSTSSEVCCF